MNALLTVPRAVARLQYEVFRVPLSMLAAPAIARLYADDAGPRLAFDKALGHLDILAGRFLGEATLLGRGEAMIRRAEALDRAKTLEHAATTDRQQASGVRDQAARQAQQRRHRTQEQAAAAAAAVRTEQRSRKVAAQKKSAVKAEAATTAAEHTAGLKLQAEERKLDRNLSTIEQRGTRRSAVPKARLEEARAVAGDAAAQRRNADRLARLATGEKTRRTTTD